MKNIQTLKALEKSMRTTKMDISSVAEVDSHAEFVEWQDAGCPEWEADYAQPEWGQTEEEWPGQLAAVGKGKSKGKGKDGGKATAAMAKVKAKDGKNTAAALAKVGTKARMEAKETREKGEAKATNICIFSIVGSGGTSEKIAQFQVAGRPQHPLKRQRLSHQGL